MSYKIKANYIVMAMAGIIGAALAKQIDFKSFTVEKPALVLVYGIALLICVGFMIKKSKSK